MEMFGEKVSKLSTILTICGTF